MYCNTCKFRYELTGFEGECNKLSKGRSDSIRAIASDTYRNKEFIIITAANFGCVLYEKKGEKNEKSE